MLAGEAAIRLHLSVERGHVTAAVTPAASAAVPSPERRRRPGAISHASSLSPTTERELALSQLQRRREKEARKELLHCDASTRGGEEEGVYSRGGEELKTTGTVNARRSY